MLRQKAKEKRAQRNIFVFRPWTVTAKDPFWMFGHLAKGQESNLRKPRSLRPLQSKRFGLQKLLAFTKGNCWWWALLFVAPTHQHTAPLSIKQMLHAPPIDALPLLKRFFWFSCMFLLLPTNHGADDSTSVCTRKHFQFASNSNSLTKSIITNSNVGERSHIFEDVKNSHFGAHIFGDVKNSTFWDFWGCHFWVSWLTFKFLKMLKIHIFGNRFAFLYVAPGDTARWMARCWIHCEKGWPREVRGNESGTKERRQFHKWGCPKNWMVFYGQSHV